MFIQILFFNQIHFLLLWCVSSFCMLDINILRDTICKYFLSFSGLTFNFVDDFLCQQRLCFLVWFSPTCIFLLLLPFVIRCKESFPRCVSKTVYVFFSEFHGFRFFIQVLDPFWSNFYVWLGVCTEKAMAPHSSTLAWKIPWMEEPGRLQSMGSRRVGHNWVTLLSLFTITHWRRKWQLIPVFLPGKSQWRRNLVGCCLWGHTESDTTEVN